MRTRRGGAAAKAGHDLLIEVGSWEGTLQLADDPAASSVSLTADAGALFGTLKVADQVEVAVDAQLPLA